LYYTVFICGWTQEEAERDEEEKEKQVEKAQEDKVGKSRQSKRIPKEAIVIIIPN
jgi:hypothetical protein